MIDFQPFGRDCKSTRPDLTVAVDSFRLWHDPGKKFGICFADGLDDDVFDFPEAALVTSFDYFKIMLRPGSEWSECQASCVYFKELSSDIFGVLVTWLQSGLLRMPQDPVETITASLCTISTADYLQMVNLDKYIETVKSFLAKTLRANRRALDKSHLSFMRDKDVLFRTKARSIAVVAAKAAVKRFLTCHLNQAETRPLREIRGRTGRKRSGTTSD
ncbi:hypothetical protein GE09DRAFT_1254720 [Coniochaeta sp. 2T2.1]|nr:hypothetical protein GE09DRAFT_1254720 [Coniochaeta sp. 2T2.1]